MGISQTIFIQTCSTRVDQVLFDLAERPEFVEAMVNKIMVSG